MAGLGGEVNPGSGIPQAYFMVLLCILNLLKITVQELSHSLPVLLPYLWQQESLAQESLREENCNVHRDFSLLREGRIPPFGPNCQLHKHRFSS